MTTKLKAIVDKVSELKKLMQEQGQEALKEAFKEFFAAHPEAEAVVWTQYTPYFNDGDACTFSVGDMELKVDGSKMAEDVQKLLGYDPSQTEDEDEDDSYGHGDSCAAKTLMYLPEMINTYWDPVKNAGLSHRKLTAKEKSLVKDFNELTSACGKLDEVFQLVFGDHCQVVATAAGFGVSEVDHD
jgi:hypothetical protein